MKLASKKLSLFMGLFAITVGNSFAAGLPDPGVEFNKSNTAVVITDPQIDFLSPKGVSWGGVVGKSVTENNTVEHIDDLFKSAKAADLPVFVSPHYYLQITSGITKAH